MSSPPGHDWVRKACGATARCPHRCGPLRWVGYVWRCPRCGDDWSDAETFGPCKEATTTTTTRESNP